MVKRIKHSLEYLIDKSSRHKTSRAEEYLLHNFTFSEYQKSNWDTTSMGNPDEVAQDIYNNIQIRIRKKKNFNPYLQYMSDTSIHFLVGIGF